MPTLYREAFKDLWCAIEPQSSLWLSVLGLTYCDFEGLAVDSDDVDAGRHCE